MPKHFKKIIAVVLAASLAASLAGCADENGGNGGYVDYDYKTDYVNYDSEYQGNPYLPLWEYTPDVEPYVFEDPDNPGSYRLYVYGSHDMLKTEYCGKDLVVWSAPVEDLSDWRCDGVIFESIVDGSADTLYAPDVTLVEKDGKKTYYLYPNNQAWGRGTMVCSSDRPDGPFEVINWKPWSTTDTGGGIGYDGV